MRYICQVPNIQSLYIENSRWVKIINFKKQTVHNVTSGVDLPVISEAAEVRVPLSKDPSEVYDCVALRRNGDMSVEQTRSPGRPLFD
jgi:sugar diacid utilization regulator